MEMSSKMPANVYLQMFYIKLLTMNLLYVDIVSRSGGISH